MDDVIKLTDQTGRTRGDTQWDEGVTHYASGDENQLCTPGVIHAYSGWELALLMNPIHANFTHPLVWEARGEIVAKDGTKLGCNPLTTIRRIVVPEPTLEQRLWFAREAAYTVYPLWKWYDRSGAWLQWYNNPHIAAADAHASVRTAATDAYDAYAAVIFATDAYVDECAANVGDAAHVTRVAYIAAIAARAAVRAADVSVAAYVDAHAAARAAARASFVNSELDLAHLASQALIR